MLLYACLIYRNSNVTHLHLDIVICRKELKIIFKSIMCVKKQKSRSDLIFEKKKHLSPFNLISWTNKKLRQGGEWLSVLTLWDTQNATLHTLCPLKENGVVELLKFQEFWCLISTPISNHISCQIILPCQPPLNEFLHCVITHHRLLVFQRSRSTSSILESCRYLFCTLCRFELYCAVLSHQIVYCSPGDFVFGI